MTAIEKRKTPTRQALETAAMRLEVDLPTIRAFAAVEAPRGPFQEGGHPTILFERHVFHRLTGGRFDAVRPDLSNVKRGGYGKYSEQPGKLAAARLLDESAAISACSWGMFQIMGENYRRCGFFSPQHMEQAMWGDADTHLAAFVSFVESSGALTGALQDVSAALRAGDRARVTAGCVRVARLYNGPKHPEHDYAGRFERALYKAATG